MAVVIKGSGSIEGSTGLEMGANGTTEIRGQVNVAVGSSVAGVSTATQFAPTDNQLSNRNMVINGDFSISQRGESGVNMSTNAYLLDRFKAMSSTDGEGAVTRDSDTPTQAESNGSKFPYSLKVDCTTADTSLASSQYIIITHRIEGKNVAHLAFGTAGTRYATLSFWVKAPAGTYCVSFRNSAYNRTYLAEYTVSSADTWGKHIITIPIDTSGTWLTTNGMGLDIQWALGTGSSFQGAAGSWAGANYHGTSNQYNLFSSTSNNFFLTGVQFEAGSTATAFEHRSYGDELARCHRYYYKITGSSDQIAFGYGRTNGTTSVEANIPLPVPLRASPSVTCAGNTAWSTDNSSSTTAPTVRLWDANRSDISLVFTGHSSLTNARGANVFCNSGSNLELDSEL